MGKICRINGQPYSVGLPTGGENWNDHNNQWDEMIDFLGEDCDNFFHWKDALSWCQEQGKVNAFFRAVRGYNSARGWHHVNAAYSDPRIGFRPVLVPLSADTLKPDLSLLADIPNGQRIALASLYVDGEPVDLSEKEPFCYKEGTELVLGDRDKNKDNWLYVIKYKDLLWVDQNILVDISWDELQKQGYVD